MHTLELLRSGKLAGTRRLKLACGLREFPQEIFDLADTLEILDLSGNQLSKLPDHLPRLHQLRILFCSDNLFTTLPAILGQCTQLVMAGFKANQIRTVPGNALPMALRWLILTDNQLEELPASIGQCGQLQKLMLAGNQLRTLPHEMAACTRLELLRVAANQLNELPAWLLSLPKLSWLAYAGNPFCEAHEKSALTEAPIPSMDWGNLTLQHQLGEGASGVIHQAEYQSSTGRQRVAVKLFKGEVTSDGLPQSEMAACIRAGQHPGLIPVLGKVANHPEGMSGMVMSLIDPDFVNLAGPPSLASCTRDVYAADSSFSLTEVIHLARDIASAARHLHINGLMHGDLYAHNILHNAQGAALLGDFGAASFHAPESIEQALALQRLEVRAFACLLEELLERCDASTASQPTLKILTDLKMDCLQKDTCARPLFGEIEQRLMELALSSSEQPDAVTPVFLDQVHSGISAL